MLTATGTVTCENQMKESGVSGVEVRTLPWEERGEKGHLGPPLTTKNEDIGQHVSQETLMCQQWLGATKNDPVWSDPLLVVAHLPDPALKKGNP